MNWERADDVLRQINVAGNARNELVTIQGHTEGLHCIGVGTDAAVFAHEGIPGCAFKVYSEDSLHKKDSEKLVYDQLAGIPYFPHCYGSGSNYLVLSHEAGVTLYDCLLQGILVPEQVILDVQDACMLARGRGLNPRDIHLKNVILQDGRGKVLDVSEYLQAGDDKRWEHLVYAYEQFYPSIAGRKIPTWVLESIKTGYAKVDQWNGGLDEFAQRIYRLFSIFTR